MIELYAIKFYLSTLFFKFYFFPCSDKIKLTFIYGGNINLNLKNVKKLITKTALSLALALTISFTVPMASLQAEAAYYFVLQWY